MNSHKILSFLVILLSITVMSASMVYLVSGNMIPGLIPLCSAALMIPFMLLWGKQENSKIYSVIFMISALLNLIAAILQIHNAL